MSAPCVTGIYFVRHGETDWNRAMRLQGTIDTLLNRIGPAQRARVTVFDGHSDDPIEFLSKSALALFGLPRDMAAANASGAYVNSSSYRAHGLEITWTPKWA